MISSSLHFKQFKLNPIVTLNKPGNLVDVDLSKICENNNLQFTTSKSFYINNLNSIESRGNHSNNNATEILFCLSGSFDIYLHDGSNETTLHLKENDAIFINKNVWIQFNNFKNCVIWAFVDIDENKEKKSCYDFDTFLQMHKK